MKKRGQYAIEYLIVVALSALILLPLMLMILNQYSALNFAFNTHQASVITNKVTDASLIVYYLGEGSMKTMFVTVPSGIESSSVSDNEVLYKVQLNDGMYVDIYDVSPVNITGSIPISPGVHKIRIISMGDYVWVGS